MKYFRILNLSREPFSNSPDPEFSFRSGRHVICLARLELSIRFRRGLHVVMGEVGTGKTTLCRQLIRRVADDEKLEMHLILDPCFSTPEEFLKTICAMFGLDSDRQERFTSWQLKEYIKHYIFRRGIDEEKIVALVIDEGQKLPDFCLEILREFLNYETNEYKLFQTVIFAQKEFRKTIEEYPNFADRISYCHELGHLSFRETRQMIRYRLTMAKAGYETPALFSFFGLLAVYLATGGYPRKIVHLCHRVLLALIIRGESKAGWTLVWWCARMLYPSRRKLALRVYAPALALAVVLVLCATAAIGPLEFPLFSGTGAPKSLEPRSSFILRKPLAQVLPREEPLSPPNDSLKGENSAPAPEPPIKQAVDTQAAQIEAPGPKPPEAESSVQSKEEKPSSVSDAADSEPVDSKVKDDAASAPESADPLTDESSLSQSSQESAPDTAQAASLMEPTEDEAASSAPEPAQEKDFPDTLGRLSVGRHGGLEKMMRKIYGTSDEEYLKQVMQANPGIKDKNRILLGSFINFPAIKVESAPPKDCWYVQVAEKDNLNDAYEFSSSSIPGASSLRLIPYWVREKGIRFSVILNRCFDTPEAAQSAIKELSPSVAATAFHPADLEGDAVFFAR